MGRRWIKARRSQSLGACVELAGEDEGVVMRSSRRPDDHIHHTMTEFAVFLEAAKNGEFGPPGQVSQRASASGVSTSSGVAMSAHSTNSRAEWPLR
jgi:Domain of unknown function (DUF397)